MAAEEIGPAKCPLCGGRARVSVSKAKLCVMTMNCCKAQLFARGDQADMLIRGLLLPKDAPEPVRENASAPATDPVPPPAAEPVRRGWLASLLEDD